MVLNETVGQEMIVQAKSASGRIKFEKTMDSRIVLTAHHRITLAARTYNYKKVLILNSYPFLLGGFKL
jgi:hypothetical protein